MQLLPVGKLQAKRIVPSHGGVGKIKSTKTNNTG